MGRVTQEYLQLGPLAVGVHRTVCVSPDQMSSLPPNLGYFEVYKVANFRKTCPDYWEDDAHFVAMHPQEALWFSFSTLEPVAIMVGAGGINALTGSDLCLKLEKDNYMVSPPQPWIDGWKDQDGTVYQFVGTYYQKGEGKTVGEQLLKEKSKTGGIGIAVFKPKEKQEMHKKPDEVYGYDGDFMCCASDSDFELCSFDGSTERKSVAEMGVGKGGKITQKIYPDPYGIEKWEETATAVAALYIVNAEQFSEITGEPLPPLPKCYADYMGAWFGLKDKHLEDVAGSVKFTGLNTVFAEKVSCEKQSHM